MQEEEPSWCLIESDPGVFWDITRKLGVQGVEYQEILSLDDETFIETIQQYEEIYGLIFLFRWHKDCQAATEAECLTGVPPGLFFARQMIQNSCATQAMLGVLLNIDDKVDIGSELKCFKDFVKDFPPDLIGQCLATQESIRAAHNSYRVTHALQITSNKDDKEGDAFHYVAFVPQQNHVYQLDGLKPGPIRLPAEVEEPIMWWKSALPAIRTIINQLQTVAARGEADIRFNLIAVVPDRLQRVQSRLAEAQAAKHDLMINELQASLESEKRKREAWEEENVYRRADLMPFLLCSMKHLAKRGLLQPAYEKAQQQL